MLTVSFMLRCAYFGFVGVDFDILNLVSCSQDYGTRRVAGSLELS